MSFDFETYKTVSYALAIVSGFIMGIRGLYLYFKISDEKLLDQYRVHKANLSDVELLHYNKLAAEIDASLEILCKMPAHEVFSKEVTKLSNDLFFDFVICDKKYKKIKLLADITGHHFSEKAAICEHFGFQLVQLPELQPENKVVQMPDLKTVKPKRTRMASPDPFSRKAKREYRKSILKI